MTAQLHSVGRTVQPDEATQGQQTTGAMPGAPPVGPTLTQQQANEVFGLYRDRRYEEALEKTRELIAVHYNLPLLHNLAGAIHSALGQSHQAIGSYRRAIALRPNRPEGHNNLGDALNRIGRHEEAIGNLATAVTLKPDFAEAHNNLGIALAALGRHREAVGSLRRACELRPGFAEAHARLGDALMQCGEYEEAADAYRTAIEARPNMAEAHAKLGRCLIRLGRAQEGAEACHRALAIDNGHVPGFIALSAALEQLDETGAAIRCLEHVIRIEPRNVDAHDAFCGLLERSDLDKDLRNAVSAARKSCGEDDPRILYRIARLAALDGDHATARRCLDRMPPDSLSREMADGRLSLLAESCERLGDFDAAFKHHAALNGRRNAQPAARTADPVRYMRDLEDLAASFSETDGAPWEDVVAAHPRTPVFLVGFPQSGTDRLGAILRGHPDIALLENKPMVARMAQALGESPDRERLQMLTADDIDFLRGVYFEELDRHLDLETGYGTVIDSLPLNMASAGLIERVFPRARFVMALRHPCDCVLSCFTGASATDDIMGNFLELETGATLYDRAMRLWTCYRYRLALAVHEIRYEELLANPTDETAALARFLGVDPGGTARAVPEPLFADRVGRWEDYRMQIEPVFPLLESWARRQGS
ncbi:tetratricopeptide repeat-containing sulfotransferase family protein [Oricola indica]|jgi:tetratricopeptide (TPR) repeat protein|uniref:tetratricopeptide repeat-containing sulfotransferase family protein n=1 Tax=Oricola indica TaxID=2872591 RepID=UPI001CBC99A1|nr:tetratricopeptide repeat-containing sulfotransferase family protein [Oricola indica]